MSDDAQPRTEQEPAADPRPESRGETQPEAPPETHTETQPDTRVETQPVSDELDPVGLARADVAAGREWKARERLRAHLAEHHDLAALELLGEVSFGMRDLPAAGAAWFGTTRRGADVDEAFAAWRERYDDRFPEMWRSLPRLVREHRGNARVDALRRRAEADVEAGRPATAAAAKGDPDDGGVDAAVVIAVGLAGLFVLFAVIGFIWVLSWLVPG